MTEKERKWYQKKYAYTQNEEGVRIYKTNYWNVTSVSILIPSILLVALSFILLIGWATNVGAPVRREFGNYINSAEDMYDPHLVIRALEQATEGIENLGLQPTDNAAIFSWDKNYRHTPQFTIDQIASVIAFADNFIEWKEQSYSTGVIEVAADVYNEKMYHLRDIADNINTNTIATAYCLNTPGLFWYAHMFTLFTVGGAMFMVALLFAMMGEDK